MPDTPFLAVGNDELGPELVSGGDTLTCPHCGEQHEIKDNYGVDRHGRPTNFALQSYRCGDKVYLAGIDHRSLLKPRADS